MSLVAKSFTVFRKTTDAGGDPGTDIIIFNDPDASAFKNTTKEGAYIITLERGDPEGIGNNQAAELFLNDLAHRLAKQKVVIVSHKSGRGIVTTRFIKRN